MTAENSSAFMFIGERELMQIPAELKSKNHREAIQIAQDNSATGVPRVRIEERASGPVMAGPEDPV